MSESTVNLDSARPPKWPLKILRLFVRKQYLEEIEGDMEEVFHDNLLRGTIRKARRMYAIETLKLLRPILMKNLAGVQVHSQQAMFLNYFKISFRNLMRNPLNSFINVFGLAAAIGVCIFSYGFTRWTYSTDQFHKLKNEVYLMTFFADRDGTAQQYGTTPRPIGEFLRNDVPQITRVCRIEDWNVVVKRGPDVFHERIRFADPEFLDMLTFPLKWGSASTLKDQNSIILSEDMSVKYFGDANPVGSTLLVKFDKDNGKEFKITGVAAAFPDARTVSFNFLLNIENLRVAQNGYDFDDWKLFFDATLIQVPNPSDLALVKQAAEKYRALQNESVSAEWAISSFNFEPLATLHEKASDIRDDISRSSDGNYTTILFLLVISLAFVALACFNYINIAIVTATKRLKEIGVRKSIGANRRTVIVQFLSENMVIMFFAVVLGLGLGALVFIPLFEAMWGFSMEFTLRDARLWLFLPSVLLFTSIASGIYPSLYISKFQVVGILKGSLKFGQRNPITKVFLGFQLIVCCIFITGAIMFNQNTRHMSSRPWGYDQSSTMYAVVEDQASFDQLSALMAREPDVVSMAGSTNHLGKSQVPVVIHFGDREYEVDQLSVDARYFETMGLTIQQGRSFHQEPGSDHQAVIINELLAKNLVWTEPVGKLFKIDSTQFEVIGVVKDFHAYNFSRQIKPQIFRVAGADEYRYLSLKVRDGAEIKTYKTLQDKWAELLPEVPFAGGLQEDVWGPYFEETNIQTRVWDAFALIAVTLAVLGLYGLVSLNVEGRVREFSIRKVLGANAKAISGNILRQYTVMFIVALVIGAPVGHYLMAMVLHMVSPYSMPITLSAVTFSVLMLVIILLATVSTQVRKVLKSNPVEGLKVE